jgi:hypothetical protein
MFRSPDAAPHPLVIEVLDEDRGLAEVEWLSPGGEALTFELPIGWLPAGVQEGDGYAVSALGDTLTFRADPEAARQLRERSKQTLLDFSDQPEGHGQEPE